MTQLVNYKESYDTMTELLDRIGYIRTMLICPVVKDLDNSFNTELLDREIELIERVANMDDNKLVFITEHFGEINTCKAKELCVKLELPMRV